MLIQQTGEFRVHALPLSQSRATGPHASTHGRSLCGKSLRMALPLTTWVRKLLSSGEIKRSQRAGLLMKDEGCLLSKLLGENHNFILSYIVTCLLKETQRMVLKQESPMKPGVPEGDPLQQSSKVKTLYPRGIFISMLGLLQQKHTVLEALNPRVMCQQR